MNKLSLAESMQIGVEYLLKRIVELEKDGFELNEVTYKSIIQDLNGWFKNGRMSKEAYETAKNTLENFKKLKK